MSGEGFKIADGFVEVHGDTSSFEKDVDNSLRDSKGKFTRGGQDAGRAFGDGTRREGSPGVNGFVMDVAGILDVAHGKFNDQGRKSGEDFGYNLRSAGRSGPEGMVQDSESILGRIKNAFGAAGNDAGSKLGDGANNSSRSGFMSMFSNVSMMGIAIGAALLGGIPLIAVLGAGIGTLAAAFAAAGIGAAGFAAVAIPAISSVINVMKLQSAVNQQAAQTAASNAQQARSNALAIVSAQDSVTSSTRNLVGAQTALTSAYSNAAYAHRQAVQSVISAEQSLISSEQSATNAQIALTQARLAETRALQDQANNSIDAKLAEQQATFSLADAQLAYNQVTTAGSGATADQIARAKLALDQAKQQLVERHLATLRAIEDEKAGAKAGVEGSNSVRLAREALARATQGVTNAERALADARTNVARTDVASANAIASAQRGLASAQDAVTAANRGLAAAQQNAAYSAAQASGAQTALAQAMAKLSPSAIMLLGHFQSLSRAWTAWKKSMDPIVLPVIAKGVDLLKSLIPALTPFVEAAAKAFNGLINGIGTAAQSPFWVQFRNQLAQMTGPAITGLGIAMGNIITGIAGIFKAFLPYVPAMMAWIDRITAGFAKWGMGLSGSSAIKTFMDYVKNNGPTLEGIVSNLSTAIGHIVLALASPNALFVQVLKDISSVLAGLSPSEIQALADAFLAWKAAMVVGNLYTITVNGIKAVVGIMVTSKEAVLAFSAALRGVAIAEGEAGAAGAAGAGKTSLITKIFSGMGGALRWVGLAIAGVAGAISVSALAIGAAFVAIGALWVVAYEKIKWFHDAVNHVISQYAQAFVELWKAVVWFSNLLGAGVKKIIDFFQWMYDKLIGHSIIPDTVNGIVNWFGKLPNAIGNILSWFGKVPGMFGNWLGSAVSTIAQWLSSAVGYFANLPGQIMNAIGGLGNMLYNAGRNVIQGFINGIVSMASSLWNTVSGILQGIGNLLPHSPAKEGPFSGKGWTLYSGQAMVQGLADGITANSGAAKNAMVKATTLVKSGIQGVNIANADKLPARATAAVGVSAGACAGMTINGGVTIKIDAKIDFTKGVPRDFATQMRDAIRQLERDYK